jgi:hypothetical protein
MARDHFALIGKVPWVLPLCRIKSSLFSESHQTTRPQKIDITEGTRPRAPDVTNHSRNMLTGSRFCRPQNAMPILGEAGASA